MRAEAFSAGLAPFVLHGPRLDPAAFEALALRLLVAQGRSLSLGVTAAESGAGVSTVAAHLALAFAVRLRRPTVLADLHFAAPAVARLFGCEAAPGVAEILAGAVAPAAAVQAPAPHLSVIAAGCAAVAPGALLDDARFPELQRLLAERFDVVVYDCPPMSRFGETAVAAGRIGAMLLVVAAERTRMAAAGQARRDIEEAGGRLAGAVLNRHRRHLPAWLDARL